MDVATRITPSEKVETQGPDIHGPDIHGLDVHRHDVHNPKELILALRRAMPAEAFEPQPLRGVIALLIVAFYVFVLGGLVVSGVLPGWLNLIVGFVIGQLWVTVGFTAHEALHKSVFRSRFWENVIGWLGFSVWLVSPGLWRGWHVLAHHGSTNMPGHDPDMLDTVADWKQKWMPRLIYWVTPGSGHLLSYISPIFLFTMQGQLFLWYYSSLPEYEKIRMNRAQERLLSVLILMGWIALGMVLGWPNAFYLIVVPMMVSNATLMAYIASNHWLRPATPDGTNPFVNAASVSVSPFWDLLHVNFSFHQEHHIFPQMNPKFAPLLRAHLQMLAPHAVNVMPMTRAILELYRRPPLYSDDPATFASPDGQQRISVAEIQARSV